MQKIKDLELNWMEGSSSKQKRVIKKALWLLSTARNAIVVLICSIIAYLYSDQSPNPKSIVALTGEDRL